MGHVTRPRYGKGKNTLSELYEFADKVGALNNGWEVSYFMAAFYDAAYGHADRMYLENYEKKEVTPANRPLSMVSMNTREGLMEMNGWAKRAAEYDSYKVSERLGMSFDKWVQLPTSVLENLLAGLRHNFQQQQAEVDRIRREEQDRQNLGGARDPAGHAIDRLSQGSQYKA